MTLKINREEKGLGGRRSRRARLSQNAEQLGNGWRRKGENGRKSGCRDARKSVSSEDCIHEVLTWLNTLTTVFPLLSLGLRLCNGVLEVPRGTFYVDDKLLDILHDVLNGKMQLRVRTGISTGKKIRSRRAGTISRLRTFPMGIFIVPVLSPLHSVVPCSF